MKAHEAREVAEGSRRASMDNIYWEIEESASSGELYCTFRITELSDKQIEQLREDGYGVEGQVWSDYITVHW